MEHVFWLRNRSAQHEYSYRRKEHHWKVSKWYLGSIAVEIKKKASAGIAQCRS